VEVTVVNIHTGHMSVLPDVTRLGISEDILLRIGGIWANPFGFTINLFRPAVVSCDTSYRPLAWKYPLLIKDPYALR